MAKSFSSLKTHLNLYDKLTFGKYKDCRVCDLLPDYVDYLVYLQFSKIVKFDASVTEAIEDILRGQNAVIVEVGTDNKYQELCEVVSRLDYFSDMEDDIPF